MVAIGEGLVAGLEGQRDGIEWWRLGLGRGMDMGSYFFFHLVFLVKFFIF